MNPLSDLSLDDLRGLNDRLTGLVTAGFRLEQGGLAPRFDLTPGMPIRITLGAVMPSVDRPSFGDWIAAQPQSTEAASQPADAQADAVADLRQPEPVDAPSTTGEGVEGAIISAEPSRSAVSASPKVEAPEAPAESGGGPEVAAPAPAAPVPGSASALAAASSLPAPWTAAEDKTLVDTIVALMIGGMARKPAATEASKLLPGRTADACIYRAHTKAKDTINALVAEAAILQAQTETPEIPEAVPPLSQGDAAAEGHSSAAAQSTDPLLVHLCTLTDKGGWSLQRDLDLMELSNAGWPAADIAREIQMPDAAIKPRFDALTGLHDDEATGKKARRWSREEVLGALLVIAGKAAA